MLKQIVRKLVCLNALWKKIYREQVEWEKEQVEWEKKQSK